MRNNWLKWLLAGIGVIAVLFLALGAFWAGHLAARGYSGTNYGWNSGGMMGGWGSRGMMGTGGGPGMMGDWGGRGMMGTWGGPGMMGNYGYSGTGSGSSQSPLRPGNTLTIDQAEQTVDRYVAASGNPDLAVDEVMEFDSNFYAIVKEKSTNVGAFEVVVDKWRGIVSPEPGPNMMWNARYGMMGSRGMMGGGYAGGYAQANRAMPVSAAEAASIGQQWLDQNLPGVQVHADDVDPFYGYYTLHVWKDGQVYGMLSVNGASGQVWYHTWHGNFIALLEK